MSLTLTLKITPEHSKWVGSATLNEENRDRHTQKELAMRLQMTGDEVTLTLSDLGFHAFGSNNGWSNYQTIVEKSNRDVCLLCLKTTVIGFLKYLISKNVDIYVKTTHLHDTKILGWLLSKNDNVLAQIEEWQG